MLRKKFTFFFSSFREHFSSDGSDPNPNHSRACRNPYSTADWLGGGKWGKELNQLKFLGRQVERAIFQHETTVVGEA